ncbi:MAG: serine hydrolase [Ignavibacteria bacterium]|nr:serine hydrolase [Ignavibacteria bacterium]
MVLKDYFAADTFKINRHPVMAGLIIFSILTLLAIGKFGLPDYFYSQRLNSVLRVTGYKMHPGAAALSRSLTMEQQAAQITFPLLHVARYRTDTAYAIRIDSLISQGIGGFIITPAEPQLIRETVQILQKKAEIPLLITADLETGIFSKEYSDYVLPSLMGWGAVNDSMITYRAATAVAILARYLGVQANLSPVADVIATPDNAVISMRSFSDDPQIVSRHVNTYIRAMHENGILSCVKHFPGHGATSTDSHYSLPFIKKDVAALDSLEFIPFRSAIEMGVPLVMSGHLYYPQLDSIERPASLSPVIIQALLRKQLRYNGVVISDALNMNAVMRNHTDSSAATDALMAGNDILLYPDIAQKALDGLIGAARYNPMVKQRLEEAARRVLQLKENAGILQKNQGDNQIQLTDVRSAFDKISREIIAKSAGIVQDPMALVPKVAQGKLKVHPIVIADPFTKGIAMDCREALQQVFSSRIEPVFVNENKPLGKKQHVPVIGKNEVPVVFSFLRHARYQSITMKNAPLTKLRTLLAGKRGGIIISFKNAYSPLTWGKLNTYITMYGFTHGSIDYIKKLFTEGNAGNTNSPVSIPGIQISHANINDFTRASRFSSVQSIMQKAITDSVFPGAVILVSQNGKIVYHEAFGNYTYDKNSPRVTTTTLFDLASVTKVIATTTAAMLLVDQKKLTLDARVTDYLPEFGINGKQNITIRNLLLHNSGLPPFKKFYETCHDAAETWKEIYSSGLDYTPGTKSVYSDLGIITLGKVIEKITHQSLSVYCKERIFTPLGMASTQFQPGSNLKVLCAPTEYDSYWRKRQLQGEVHDETSAMLGGIAGHAGLFSNAQDLEKLINVLLMHGRFNGQIFIDSTTVELFTNKADPLSSRGLGWDTKSDKGSSAGSLMSSRSFGHTGYTGTSVWADKANNCAVILLTNRVYPTRNNTKIIKFRPVLHDTVMNALLHP